MPIEEIKYQNKTFALIIYGNAKEKEGVQFFTPDDYSLQMGRHHHPGGKIIKPHRHCAVRVERNGSLQEVLYIEKGRVKVFFYSSDNDVIAERLLSQGDLILLIEGGHSFEFLEETKMIEIKQGPYHPQSTERFSPKEGA